MRRVVVSIAVGLSVAAGTMIGSVIGPLSPSSSSGSGSALDVGATPSMSVDHNPPRLLERGESAYLRFQPICPANYNAKPCEPSGSVTVQTFGGGSHRYAMSPTTDGSGEFEVVVPASLASHGGGFTYFATVTDETGRSASATPPGGDKVWVLDNWTRIALDGGVSGQVSEPDETLVAAGWGTRPASSG